MNVKNPNLLRSAGFLHGFGGCTSRESNPGLYRGRVLFYHWTTGASLLQQRNKTISLKAPFHLPLIIEGGVLYFLD
ncbi:hypothetical protein GQ457_09G028240 [Hibiscus cannabinus]